MQPTRRAPRAPVINIFSDAGMGKTTLASMFPVPIMLRTEDGLESVPEDLQPDVLDLIENTSQLWSQLTWLAEADHHYETVILDTVTRLDNLFIQHVIKTDLANGGKGKSIQTACGGFGAGMGQVASMHLSVRAALKKINDRGITIVILGHAGSQEFNPPDGEKYTRWNLKMHEKCISPYVDDVDFVGFIKLQSYVDKEKGILNEGKAGKAKDSGDRVIICHATASNISKNRYGIKDPVDLPEGSNPLLAIIPYYSYLFEQSDALEGQ